jgi:phi13 family phage major tail protein
MAKIGLNNFWYAKLTEAQDGTPSYGGALNLGKAVSCNVSISNNSATLYADDALAESDTSFQSGTVTLGVDDDREATFADLLGHSVTEEGEVISNSNDTAPWVGLARIIVKMVNNVRIYKVVILNKVKFSEPSDDDTTKGETVEFSTPSIEGTVATLANGDWKDVKTFSTKDAALAFIQAYFASAESTYRVVYDANGGTGSVSSETVNAGSSVTLDDGSTLTAPEGKEFNGWATSSTATTPTYEGGATITPTGDLTLFAVWATA